jgi:hypothetical protein
MLKLLDLFFTIFHILLILFNLFGWIYKKTLQLNLITLTLTACSWSVLGIFYGFGYCPLTAWHFKILEKMGKSNLPDSYIKYLVDSIFKTNVSATIIDMLTLIFFLVAFSISLILNAKQMMEKKRTT